MHGAFLLKRIVCCEGNRGNLEKKKMNILLICFNFTDLSEISVIFIV